MVSYVSKFINLVEEANERDFTNTIAWFDVLLDIVQETFGVGRNEAFDYFTELVMCGAVKHDGNQIVVNQEQLEWFVSRKGYKTKSI